MNPINRQNALAVAAALCFASPAFASDATPTAAAASGGNVTTTQRSADPSVNPGTAPFRDWTHRHAQQHQGRVARDDYMHEMDRRWRAMDGGQGLTPAEIDRLHGWQPGASRTYAPQQGSDNVKAD